MDGGAAAAIEVLVQTLINVSKEEISLIRGLDNDVEQLKTTLGMIQSYLCDAEKKVINQEAVKKWLRELETLAFRADNVLDEFNYHLLHHKSKTSKVLPSFFSSFNHITRTRDVAQTIRHIDMDFKSLTQKSAVFGLEAMVVNALAAVPDAAFETDSLSLDPIFIGRDDDVPKLVTNLIESTEEKFSILAVVGMGGLGKTTLARKVFNHEKIARRCQGLPLAAKVVGGVLRDKSEQEWLSIQQKWLTVFEGDNISNILKLSFDNLSSPQLKKCFTHYNRI